MKFCPKCGRDLKPAEIDGRNRLGCSSEICDYVFWDNPTPVVAALVEREGIVVLVRNKEWPQKIYGLVTGFLEKNETPESGILREVKEELGLTGQIDNFIGCYSFFEMRAGCIFALLIKTSKDGTQFKWGSSKDGQGMFSGRERCCCRGCCNGR